MYEALSDVLFRYPRRTSSVTFPVVPPEFHPDCDVRASPGYTWGREAVRSRRPTIISPRLHAT